MLLTYQTILTALLQLSFVFLAFSQSNTVIREEFVRIDTIVGNAIQSRAFPGASVLAYHKDSILFEKTYGFHTYDSLEPVRAHHLYDIASITKIYGATLALMMLYEQGKLELDEKVRKYADGFLLNRRGQASVRELLSHQSGWQSWIRFFEKMKKANGGWKKKYFRKQYSDKFPVQVTDSLYLTRDYYKKIKRWIKRADYDPDQGYVYSGLFFYLVPEIVQTLSGISYEQFLKQNFYNPLKMSTTSFRPLEEFEDSLIVPTEIDTFFRMQQIDGTVHDEGAILMNGVSGNAGLFSTARDLLKISKMLLHYGIVEEDTMLQPSTVSLFTTSQYPASGNRRALGFDKPLLVYDSIKSSVAKSASPVSFGHTGYTGTLLWIDPAADLIFIFLTNRLYPTRENKGIYERNVRPRIHQALYEAIDASADRVPRNDER